MTPRVLPAARRPKEPSFNLYRPPAVSSTPPEERAFWKWVTTPALGADAGRDAKLEEEQRVLSKAASGGGFLVPRRGRDDHAAARAASMIAQVALELETESGETVGMALAGPWIGSLDGGVGFLHASPPVVDRLQAGRPRHCLQGAARGLPGECDLARERRRLRLARRPCRHCGRARPSLAPVRPAEHARTPRARQRRSANAGSLGQEPRFRGLEARLLRAPGEGRGPHPAGGTALGQRTSGLQAFRSRGWAPAPLGCGTDLGSLCDLGGAACAQPRSRRILQLGLPTSRQ